MADFCDFEEEVDVADGLAVPDHSTLGRDGEGLTDGFSRSSSRLRFMASPRRCWGFAVVVTLSFFMDAVTGFDEEVGVFLAGGV